MQSKGAAAAVFIAPVAQAAASKIICMTTPGWMSTFEAEAQYINKMLMSLPDYGLLLQYVRSLSATSFLSISGAQK